MMANYHHVCNGPTFASVYQAFAHSNELAPSCYNAMSHLCFERVATSCKHSLVAFLSGGGFGRPTSDACGRALSSAWESASLLRHGLSWHRCGRHGSHLPPTRGSFMPQLLHPTVRRHAG